MVRHSRYIKLPNDVVLPYFEQGDSSGVPLVLLHAIADSQLIFEPLMSHLPETIHALAITQRGHGNASKPQSGYRSRNFADDLVLFMDALHLEKAAIVGGSSGGLIARRFAIDHPERVSKLILLGVPATLFDKPAVSELWRSTVSKMTDPIDAAFVRAFAEATLPHQLPPGLFETLLQENLKVPANVWKGIWEGFFQEDESELSRITAPTLILWGERDDVIPRSDQELLLQSISGSRLVVYGSAAHVPYLEFPKQVATDIAKFITETSGTRQREEQ